MCSMYNYFDELLDGYKLKIARNDPRYRLKLKAERPRLKCRQACYRSGVFDAGHAHALASALHLTRNEIHRTKILVIDFRYIEKMDRRARWAPRCGHHFSAMGSAPHTPVLWT